MTYDSKKNGTTGQTFYVLKCGSFLKFEEESFGKKQFSLLPVIRSA